LIGIQAVEKFHRYSDFRLVCLKPIEQWEKDLYQNIAQEPRPTQRAPDWWESARFQAVCVAWSGFRQSGVTSSHPPAGNASR